MPEESGVLVVKAKPERKKFSAPVKIVSKIPADILQNEKLNNMISQLPSNYNFEVHKTIWRIKQLKAKRVALQMPEGLLMFAISICDIIETFTEADTVILGDVTYGACCVDDFSAEALGVELLVHYGHSCLIPIDQTKGMKILYIFVDIKIDTLHFIETLKANFSPETKFGFVSTIQFLTTLHNAASELRQSGYSVTIPQSKPLSPGEILGCTAPIIANVDALIYLGDGRFHLEAAMISNPKLKAYRYDPYEKKFTEEFYDHTVMRETRHAAIAKSKDVSRFGLILGTLGHQGSPKVMENLLEKLSKHGKEVALILLSEIFPSKLKLMEQSVDAWIQIGCPRLSIDWGSAFSRPLLSPYESAVALGESEWRCSPESNNSYPMDFYASCSLGDWTPNHKEKSSKDDCCGSCNKTL